MFNIRIYSAEVRDVQRREVELSITLLRVNNFNSKQKMAWSICFIIYPKQQLKSEWMLTRHINSSDNIAIFFSTGTVILNYLISIIVIIFFCEITQSLWIISKSIEFELCHMKMTALKVYPRWNHESCFRWDCNNWRHGGEIISSYFI